MLSPHVSPQCVFRPGGEEEDGPFVWTERELRVRVRCRVRRVEMLGVTDGRSLKALVAQLRERLRKLSKVVPPPPILQEHVVQMLEGRADLAGEVQRDLERSSRLSDLVRRIADHRRRAASLPFATRHVPRGRTMKDARSTDNRIQCRSTVCRSTV